MTIVRISHDKSNPYVMLNKKALEDPDLSWAAKGLWAYLISRPTNWNVSVAHLAKIYCGIGGKERAIRALLNELIHNGYCTREKVHGDKGQFTKTEYVITEFKNKVPHCASADVAGADVLASHTNNNISCTDKGKQQQKKEEPAAPVVVFSCLDKLHGHITQNDKEKITRDYIRQEQVVIDAVNAILEKGFEPDVSMLKSLRAALKGKWKAAPLNMKTAKENIRINKDYCLGYPVTIKDNLVTMPNGRMIFLHLEPTDFYLKFNKNI